LLLARDWRQVIALIEVAFGEDLDIEARRQLRSMRPPPLLGPVIGLLDVLAPPGEGMMPGFVWRVGGRVVGTASVRRVHTFHHGWLISNVAVHPDWQGQGIGRALMEAAVDYAGDNGAAWIVLQVRDTNRPARALYEGMGFQSIAEVVRLRKPEAVAHIDPLPNHSLRPARWSESGALRRLARTMTPHNVLWADSLNRELYGTGRLSYLAARLKGRRRRWWVHAEAPSGSRRPWGGIYGARPGLRAAVGVEVDPRNPWHRLRLLMLPETQDEELAYGLIAFGQSQLASAAPRPVETEYPATNTAAQSALAKAGFEPVYALIHMRLNVQSSTKRKQG
jgi:ribosomal protein S18 acetylase RimI-like enzyme